MKLWNYGIALFLFFGILGVQFEQVGDAVGVGTGRRKAVCLVNERVEARVGFHQVGRHRERIVEVGERSVRMRGAGVENHLRRSERSASTNHRQ